MTEWLRKVLEKTSEEKWTESKELKGHHRVNNIHIERVQEEQWQKGTEGIFEEIMVEIFPNLMTDTNIDIQ